ncbi:MAG: hypothetical protein NVSMB6_04430 [Burkholderiaceae bacterium]
MQSLNPAIGRDIASAGSENCLRIGTRVAEFEITAIVGEGGFGIVYLAFDHSLRRVVALKEYMPGVMAERSADARVVVRSKRHQEAFDTGLRSFINEARLLAQFEHPALIRIHRFWEQNQTGYMAMRFYEGRTLKRILQDNDRAFVSESSLKRVMRSILQALDALYRVGVLHRDISPENIMIQSDGEAVLLDFGAARQIISGMTQALTVILKPGYAPIEQYADDPSLLQGPWTDIYSLSAVIYGAITGQNPPSSVARMIHDPIVPLAGKRRPGYSVSFLHAIDCGLCVRPEHRPQSIEAFLALLDADKPTLLTPAATGKSESISPSIAGSHMTAANLWPEQVEVVLSPAGYSGAPLSGVPPPSSMTPLAKVEPERLAAGSVAAGMLRPAMGKQITRPRFWSIPKPISIAGLTGALFVAVGFSVYRWESLTTSNADRRPHVTTAQRLHQVAPPVEQIVDYASLVKESTKQHRAVSTLVSTSSEEAMGGDKKSTTIDTDSTTLKAASPMRGTATAAVKEGVSAPASSITLSIKPWGNVFVDGAARGVSPPLKRLLLAEGPHAVKVTNPNFPDYLTHIDIGKNKHTARVEIDFSSTRP